MKFSDKLFRYVNKDSAYIFCVITYANSLATSYMAFVDRIHAWFEVKMPENDIAYSHAPSKGKEAILLENAKTKADGFIREILAVKEAAVGPRPILGALLKLISKPMKKLHADFDSHLYADEYCIKCKMCVKYCPLQNITFDTKPVWNGNCASCLGCVNRCPKQSIQFKNRTTEKRR